MSAKEMPRILLVDDDKDILDLLRYNFEKEGFSVKTLSKGSGALEASKKFRPDLIVLDIAMPDGNGIDVCREIRSCRRFKSIYIFFLTARSEVQYREAALETGADDFMEKLSGIRMLTNKVRAVLKNRFVIRKGIRLLSIDDLVINKRSGVVYLRNAPISLSKPEFEILFFLMQNPDKLVSRKNLIRIIWGSEMFVLDSSVHGYVESLQRKVGSHRIVTVNNDGYRLNQLAR